MPYVSSCSTFKIVETMHVFRELSGTPKTLTGMKHLILPSLMLLVACGETPVSEHTAEIPQSEIQTPSETSAMDTEGLRFGEIYSNEEHENKTPHEVIEWDPEQVQELARYTWRFRLMRRQSIAPEVVETEEIWRGSHDFPRDDGSDEYQVFQSLKMQLGTDQLWIKSLEPAGARLRYEAVCQDKRYEVEYDLKTVQIIKVIANTD